MKSEQKVLRTVQKVPLPRRGGATRRGGGIKKLFGILPNVYTPPSPCGYSSKGGELKKIFIIFFIVLCSKNTFALYNSNITNGCTGNHSFIPVFQINTYTCSSGYYLPANTEGCRPCPNGATCSGGTFTFNTTTAQGIVVNYPLNNNITNGCSANLTGQYIPVFVPNSISLTWQDENGTTVTTNTCSYGTTITLPPNPTKPGYKFTGWKVVNN